MGWFGLWCCLQLFNFSEQGRRIVSYMPANNPPPRIVLAYTQAAHTCSSRKRNRGCPTCVGVWVLHIKPFFQPVDISTPSVPSILRRREIQALWSQKRDTEIIHRNAVSRVDIAMACHRTGYDTYTQKLTIQMR